MPAGAANEPTSARIAESSKDANFEHEVANAAVLKLTTQLQVVEAIVPLLDNSTDVAAQRDAAAAASTGPSGAPLRDCPPLSDTGHLLDRLFRNDVARCVQQVSSCQSMCVCVCVCVRARARVDVRVFVFVCVCVLNALRKSKRHF